MQNSVKNEKVEGPVMLKMVKKNYEKKIKIVHTFSLWHAIIITVKTPQYII